MSQQVFDRDLGSENISKSQKTKNSWKFVYILAVQISLQFDDFFFHPKFEFRNFEIFFIHPTLVGTPCKKSIRMSFALIIHGSSIFPYSKRASRFGRDPFCRYTAENTLMPSFSLTDEQTEHQAK